MCSHARKTNMTVSGKIELEENNLSWGFTVAITDGSIRALESPCGSVRSGKGFSMAEIGMIKQDFVPEASEKNDGHSNALIQLWEFQKYPIIVFGSLLFISHSLLFFSF
jgi:hypothetical protein